ncbi:MAG: helix-turn-helix domain-containing protein [Actinomycetota bacterium]
MGAERHPEPPSSRALGPEEEQPNGNLLTADQVAEMLAVPRSWVYAETRAGRLPHVRLGRYYRYAPESIRAFVAGLERGPVPYRKYVAPGREPGGPPHE